MAKQNQNLRTKVMSAFAGLSMLGMSGCASTQGYVSNVDHQKFYDSYGEYKLVRRNNDIWMEKLDGGEGKRVTNTPEIEEGSAYFVSDGNYIAYRTIVSRDNDSYRYFVTSKSTTNALAQEIEEIEFLNLLAKEHKDKK